MLGDMDPFDFQLAESLHKTLGEVMAIPSREYVAWRAYFVWSAAQREMASKRVEPERIR